MKLFSGILFLLLLFAACKDCKKKECTNGQCINDVCVCNDGFDGPNCDVFWRDKFFGSYTTKTHICDSGLKPNYSSNVSAISSSDDGLQFSNLADLGSSVTAVVDGENHLTIPLQTVSGTKLWGGADMTSTLDTLWVHLGTDDSVLLDSCEIILVRN